MSDPSRDSVPPHPAISHDPTSGSDQPHPTSLYPPHTASQPPPHNLPSSTPHKHKHQTQGEEENLAGWGTSAERFGGMAQAGLGQDERAMMQGQVGGPVATAALSDSTSGTSSSASSFVSDGSTSDDEKGAERREAARKASEEEDKPSIAKSVDEAALRSTAAGAEEREQARKFGQGGASKSFYGGSGQGYMRMLHALANSSKEEELSSRRRHRSKKHSTSGAPLSSFTSKDDPEAVERPPSALYTHNGPPIPNDAADEEELSASESASAAKHTPSSTSDDQSPELSEFISPPERASQSTSLARCPSDQVIQTTRKRDKIRHPRRHHYRKHGRRAGEETSSDDNDDEEGGTDLGKSSIFAIHEGEEEHKKRKEDKLQPEGVALEGRADSSDEEEGDDDAEDQSAAEQVGARPGFSRRGTASTTGTAGTKGTLARSQRREKLAEKLREVFGLAEVEEVVAEYPCWLFRSILLQGFLCLTAGHLCFYAYLSQKEGATIRSGSLSVRGNKTRRYRKHWFVLKDSVLSWFPSSTDPYFPDGHIDLHYCISIEPSSKHSHHFKIATSDKRWHFSADSTASRDEWVKTLKKVVFRCQNEGESVKIAIPLEAVVDVEKSSGLEFAETIRVRVYDPEEGFEIDEYWLSYFKNLDAALDKINGVLERFRATREEAQARLGPGAGLSPVEDTTRRAIADLGETDQVRGAKGERGDDEATAGLEGERHGDLEEDGRNRSKSLGDRMSSIFGLESGLGLKRISSKNSQKEQEKSKTSPPGVASSSAASIQSTPRSSIDEPRPASSTAVPPETTRDPDSRRSSLTLNTKLAAIGGTAVPVSQANVSGQTSHATAIGSQTATPVAGSVATLRPSAQTEGGEELAAQGISPMAAAAAMPLPESGAAPGAGPLPPSITSTPSSDSGVKPITGDAGAPPALGDIDRGSTSTVSATVPSVGPAPPAEAASMPVPPSFEVTEPPPTLTPAHTYPPQPSPGPEPSVNESSTGRTRASSTLSRILSPASSAASTVSHSGRKILEVVTHRGGSSKKQQEVQEGQVVGGLITEEPEEVEGDEEGGKEEKEAEEMRKVFGLAGKEGLVEHFPAYLFRGLPIYGHAYITTSYFCFKSAVGILNKTKMILPINDIIGVSKHRSYRIGYAGLMVIIKGHEEVFFELSSADRRDACLARVEQQRETVRAERRAKGEKEDDGSKNRELQDLMDLSSSKSSDPALDNPHPSSEAKPGQPPIMFSSTTSDFVTFRPEEPLRFTCLTIGSRGDVQPYIALCKGLMAQGHKCKIASHGEYKKWVEGHGIEFAAVGGDPAELMQLMISHDFFTISFMKEAVGRFRGWLDDLLDSAWKGCQNSDVLIESPSAIAGYHIAEALRIPYYRAFTMPWTRTRAYPHAFAVPEVHMGGGYNYMTYTMFDQVFWRATSGQVNRWRKQTLNIRPTNFDAMQQHKIPFLYNFSPVVVPPPLDWRENIHVTGYWWLDNPEDSKSKKWEPPEDVIKFLDEAKEKDKKVVFIGFGSIIIPDPMEFTKVIAEAVERAGVYAIVAKGWSDRASSKGDSDEQKKEQEEREKTEAEVMDKPFILNVKSIPHDWLFPRIHGAVHHGGAGTTGASLRAGLPTIIKPFFGDQHFYADRVATLGIGTHIRNFTADNLSEALVTAVTDDKQIERARLAGEEIRKEDGVATAIECIYRDLEYARSLVPPPSEAPIEGRVSEADEEAEKHDEKKAEEDDSTLAGATSTPAKTRSRSPDRKNSASSPQGESRTTSSDEGWDVMSRGSAADASASWEKDSVSRASSTTRSRENTSGMVMSDQKEDKGDEGEAETETQSGVGARLMSMLTKGPKAIKKDA
ncbi:hypothetical protein JCM11251_002507 [Rhodosporidiobolus azoricus]